MSHTRKARSPRGQEGYSGSSGVKLKPLAQSPYEVPPWKPPPPVASPKGPLSPRALPAVDTGPRSPRTLPPIDPRQLQQKRVAKLAEVLRSSSLAQSAAQPTWKGDKPWDHRHHTAFRPPWDKRHHVIDPLPNSDGRARTARTFKPRSPPPEKAPWTHRGGTQGTQQEESNHGTHNGNMQVARREVKGLNSSLTWDSSTETWWDGNSSQQLPQQVGDPPILIQKQEEQQELFSTSKLKIPPGECIASEEGSPVSTEAPQQSNGETCNLTEFTVVLTDGAIRSLQTDGETLAEESFQSTWSSDRPSSVVTVETSHSDESIDGETQACLNNVFFLASDMSPSTKTALSEMSREVPEGECTPHNDEEDLSATFAESSPTAPEDFPKGPAYEALKTKVAEAEAPASAAPLASKDFPKGPACEALKTKVAEAEASASAAPLASNERSSLVKLAGKQMLRFSGRESDRRDSHDSESTVDQLGDARTSEERIIRLTTTKCLTPFMEEEKEVLRGFFDLHDADGSQTLGLAELELVINDIGRAPAEGSENAEELKRLMNRADLSGDGELNFEEFTSFLEEYYQSVYARLFVETDRDKGGTITKFELKGLLIKLRENGFQVSSEDILEIFMKIDQDGDGVLDWEEFCDFMCSYRRLEFNLLKRSAGFRPTELEFLQILFQEADKDGGGSLDIKEVITLLERSMSGSKVETQQHIDKIIQLFSRIDKDKSMTLDLMEFLRLLRVWSNGNGRQGSRKEILKAFSQSTGEQAQKRGKEASVLKRVHTTLEIIGFDNQNADNIEQIAEELRAIAVRNDVEDGVLAMHHGLTIEEVRCLRESFEFCDADGSGHIDPEELSVTLKNLGCAATTAPMRRAFSKTLEREEFSGNLEFHALVKFWLVYLEACADEIFLIMTSAGESEGVPVGNLVPAFYQIGQYLNKSGALSLLMRVGGAPTTEVVDRSTFMKMIEADRRDKTIAWRETCGFNESERLVIEHAFSSNCDTAGFMNRRDGHVVQALQLLNLAPPPAQHDKLMRALLRIDRAGEGTITYHDFLLVARHLENQKLYAKTQEEKEKARIAGIDSDAIQHFRQAFNDYEPNESGKVGFFKIQKLFIDLGLVKHSKERKQLQDVVSSVTGDDKSGVTFSQFLEILHELERAGIC